MLLFQSRGRVTATELTGELEVSVATARRDLEALSASAIPVYPQPGRGGGWSLVGGADAEAAAGAVMIDPTRWGERDRLRPAMVDLLQAAVVRWRKVRLTYTNRARERSERLVGPWSLVDKDVIWYLVTGTQRGQRTFRVDRIAGAEPTDEPAERRDDLTLAAAWDEAVGEVEQRRSRT